MTNAQFITLLSTGIGSFVLVILAWINQNQRLGDLREDMNRQFNRVDSRLALIEADQKEFFSVTGRLDGRIEQLSRNK